MSRGTTLAQAFYDNLHASIRRAALHASHLPVVAFPSREGAWMRRAEEKIGIHFCECEG